MRDRFYPTSTGNIPGLLSALTSIVDNDGDKDAREQVYESNREAVQTLFNTSADMFSCVPGFFDDPSHCQRHFEHLSGMSIVSHIEKDLGDHMYLVGEVVNLWCSSHAARSRIQNAKLKSLEQKGSQLPVYVCLLRELNYHWHKSFSGMIRYTFEEESHSPHILCREVGDTLVFDIHVEHKKIFSELTLAGALAAYYHICFIGQLKYPSEGLCVAILLQRKLAKVDEQGMDMSFYLKKRCIECLSKANFDLTTDMVLSLLVDLVHFSQITIWIRFLNKPDPVLST
jgi:hypothetical protein